MELPSAFTTWETLATFGGAALLVTAIVQMLKTVVLPYGVSPRLAAYVVSVLVLNVAFFFTGEWTVSSAVLSLVNGFWVMLAAFGEYEVMKSAGVYKSTTQIMAAKMNQ